VPKFKRAYRKKAAVSYGELREKYAQHEHLKSREESTKKRSMRGLGKSYLRQRAKGKGKLGV
jgi:hypothetical protein